MADQQYRHDWAYRFYEESARLGRIIEFTYLNRRESHSCSKCGRRAHYRFTDVASRAYFDTCGCVPAAREFREACERIERAQQDPAVCRAMDDCERKKQEHQECLYHERLSYSLSLRVNCNRCGASLHSRDAIVATIGPGPVCASPAHHVVCRACAIKDREMFGGSSTHSYTQESYEDYIKMTLMV